MLSITKLGIEALSRFAKQLIKQRKVPCSCIYRGQYNPLGNPYDQDAFVTTSSTILAKGYRCRFCQFNVVFKVYGWSWQGGIKEATFSAKATLGGVIKDMISVMPELSHFAILEVHDDCNNLWVYRYDKNRL